MSRKKKSDVEDILYGIPIPLPLLIVMLMMISVFGGKKRRKEWGEHL